MASVTLENGTQIAMAELQVGDKVQTSKCFQYMMPHLKKNQSDIRQQNIQQVVKQGPLNATNDNQKNFKYLTSTW